MIQTLELIILFSVVPVVLHLLKVQSNSLTAGRKNCLRATRAYLHLFAFPSSLLPGKHVIKCLALTLQEAAQDTSYRLYLAEPGQVQKLEVRNKVHNGIYSIPGLIFQSQTVHIKVRKKYTVLKLVQIHIHCFLEHGFLILYILKKQ